MAKHDPAIDALRAHFAWHIGESIGYKTEPKIDHWWNVRLCSWSEYLTEIALGMDPDPWGGSPTGIDLLTGELNRISEENIREIVEQVLEIGRKWKAENPSD